MKIEIIEPYGYCPGVRSGIDRSLYVPEDHPDKDIFMLGPVIHNSYTNQRLISKKVNIVQYKFLGFPDFLKILNQEKCFYILTAHGHSKQMDKDLKEINARFLDTTCFFVKRIHERFEQIPEDSYVIYIGNKDHIECRTSVQYLNCPYEVKEGVTVNDLKKHKNLILTNQSTHCIDHIVQEFKHLIEELNIQVMDNLCTPLRKRMNVVEERINDFEFFVVVGDHISNNARNLEKTIHGFHRDCVLINGLDEFYKAERIIRKNYYKHIGVLSATSTDNEEVEAVAEKLDNLEIKKPIV